MIDLYDLATALLEHVTQTFATENIDLPTRQYVTTGDVAIDCEQLVVQVGPIRSGLPEIPEERRLKYPRMMSVDLTVWLTRCVPTQDNQGRPPTAASLEESSVDLLRDRVVCWTAAMSSAWRSACQDASGGLGDAHGPEGGYAGCTTRVTVQV